MTQDHFYVKVIYLWPKFINVKGEVFVLKLGLVLSPILKMKVLPIFFAIFTISSALPKMVKYTPYQSDQISEGFKYSFRNLKSVQSAEKD